MRLNFIAAATIAGSLLSFAKGDGQKVKDQGDSKCRVYMAESSIPGAGMGVYSGIDLPEGADIGNPDIIIPAFDNNFPTSVLSNYVWNGDEYATHPEAETVKNFSPGILAAVNGHPALLNIWRNNLVSSDGAGLHRHKDPGAGGFTSYYDLQTIATTPIKAGMELFADYSDTWHLERKKEIGPVPLSYHYEEADHIGELARDFATEHGEEVSQDAYRLFWTYLRENMVSDELVTKLLPESFDDLEEFERKGAAHLNAPKNFIRSPEWLEENGLCMDNFRAGISTVPQAGRGAFATRFLPEGSIIAPMPLMHHCNKGSLIYYLDDDLQQKQKQVLLNYCFGHSSSPILLCPYGALTGLINHKSDSPNAKIRWSTSKYHNADWLKMPLNEVCSKRHSSLMFDLIATQDITPGDEIFIDYGEEWEMAWKKHIDSWVPPEDSESYVSASTLNKTETVVKTNDEQKDDPYPSNVYTECYFLWNEDEEFAVDGGIVYATYQGYVTNSDLHKCKIKSRESINDVDTYTVAMIIEDDKVIADGVPRDAIKFSDEVYSTDMHLSGAFRHEIMIPDEMFPEQWKTLPKILPKIE